LDLPTHVDVSCTFYFVRKTAKSLDIKAQNTLFSKLTKYNISMSWLCAMSAANNDR